MPLLLLVATRGSGVSASASAVEAKFLASGFRAKADSPEGSFQNLWLTVSQGEKLLIGDETLFPGCSCLPPMGLLAQTLQPIRAHRQVTASVAQAQVAEGVAEAAISGQRPPEGRTFKLRKVGHLFAPENRPEKCA